MSWLYLPEQVVGYSQADCLDGDQYVMLSLTNIVPKSCKLESEMAISTMPQSGTMPGHSTGNPGVDVWISSLLDFHASRSQLPESKRRKVTTATSGQIPSESFAKYDQGTRFWKTSQGCLPDLMDISDRYLETWPKAGMMLDGVCYRQPQWEHRISGKGSGYWRTPQAANATQGTKSRLLFAQRMMERQDVTLVDQVTHGKLRPTPTAQDYGGSTRDDFSPKLSEVAKRWPTPTSRDHKDTGEAVVKRNVPVNSLLGRAVQPTKMKGSLDPEFVEYLMGFPRAWTDLKPLEMPKFQKWREEHGWC